MRTLFKYTIELHPAILGAVLALPLVSIMFLEKEAALIALNLFFGAAFALVFLGIAYYFLKKFGKI